MRMVILVADGYRQGAGHSFGWTATVAHDDGNEKLFLALAVKRPQSCQCRCAIQVVLEIEIIAMAIFRGDGETERWSIFWGVLVHSPDEG